MFALVMVELNPFKTEQQLNSALSSHLSISRYLNKKMINALIERQLIEYTDYLHTSFTLIIENTDKNLEYFLEIIKNANKSEQQREGNLE